MADQRRARCFRCRRPITERPYRTERWPDERGDYQPAVFYHDACETRLLPGNVERAIVRHYPERKTA